MEERMRMILPDRDMERMTVDNEIVTVNVHGLSLNAMIRLLKNISVICMGTFTLRIIHGFNHGTKLKDAIRTEGLFLRSYKIVPDQTNPGVTMIVFA
ncbi:hypothetical protein SAMN04487760_10527 [Lachnospiraceae bacterium G41]|nr:hypothetical protein SAMN04487760_10527 [Lachnospiraceae bacterium G41]